MIQFVDTSALFALLDEDDGDHDQAVDHLAGLAHDTATLLTSEYVLVETTALLQRRLGMALVRRLHEHVVPALDVAPVGSGVRLAAVAALLAADKRDVSLVDWVSFEVMRRQGVDVAFAFDDDFTQQGFTLVP